MGLQKPDLTRIMGDMPALIPKLAGELGNEANTYFEGGV